MAYLIIYCAQNYHFLMVVLTDTVIAKSVFMVGLTVEFAETQLWQKKLEQPKKKFQQLIWPLRKNKSDNLKIQYCRRFIC